MTDAVVTAALPETRSAEPAAEPQGSLQAILDELRGAFARKGPLTAERRTEALDGLATALLRHRQAVADAIAADFGHRSPHETAMGEIYPVLAGLRHARRRLRGWMKPRRRPIAMLFRPGTGRVIHQPLGVVGIISPWNYPVQLALAPLTGAIAAGNRVMIKPSEFTPRTAALLERIVGEVFAPDEVRVVQGGPEVGEAFSRLRFDRLFFTGSTPVGRRVMQAAARNLVPVTLELGGKSPAIVAPDYPVEAAAESIAAGKLFNAGQTCIAPDYALVPRNREEAFRAAYGAAAARLYPTIRDNPDYTAIVSERHYHRLRDLVEDARRRGAVVEEINPAGEVLDPGVRKLPPVLLARVPADAAVMREEIFGPLLPVVPYDDLDGACAAVNAGQRPLALYLFSHDQATVDRTLERTVSGGVTVNDTLLHVVQDELPFGGVGDSGMGAYHGEEGFRTFSHAKAVFHQARLNGGRLTRPPYGRAVDLLLRLILR